jgi:hypothetical protein
MLSNRRLWLGALALAAAVLTQALPARAAADNRPETAPEPVSKYLPNDSDYVVRVNFQQAQKAPLLKKALGQLKEHLHQGEAQKILGALGFDPLKDLSTLTVAGPISQDPKKPLAIINGRFDQDKFNKAAEEHAKQHADHLKIEKKFGHKVWVVSPPNPQPNAPDTYYVVLADKHTIFVTAGEDPLKEALEKISGKATTKLNKELAPLVAKINPEQTLTVLLLPGAIAHADFLPPQVGQLKKALEKYKTVRVGLTLGEDIKLKTIIGAVDENAAKQLGMQIKKGLTVAPALLGLAAMQNEQIAPFIDTITDVLKTIKTEAKGSSVEIRSTISKELIKKMEEAAKKAKADQ